MLLSLKEIAALQLVYRLYRKKKKVERRVIEEVFYRTTGKRLGKKYWAIPVVRRLVELSG